MDVEKNIKVLMFDFIIQKNIDFLKIKRPKILYKDRSFFSTPTTQSATADTGKEIALNTDFTSLLKKDEIQACAILSHELRHCFQMQKKEIWEKELKKYKTSNLLSLNEYNEQLMEIDAWAWAFIMCRKLFRVKLTFEPFSEELKNRIYERADFILQY